ncbi:latent-transforming growth factor beta-binding protein 4 isoform X2 [Lepisosteus oculatus]|uniref:latent-transforming growth factor beta-binding protein 4 isoform X2 n=1 Tax=Lepisosteus oculatus TaxID=7918 RepID=UPI00372113A6
MLSGRRRELLLTCVGLALLVALSRGQDTETSRSVPRVPVQETPRVARQRTSDRPGSLNSPGEPIVAPRAKTKIPKIKAPAKVRSEATNSTKKNNKLPGPNVCGAACCAGWTVAPKTKKCTKPRCSPRCANGGICKRPQVCLCRAGFEGPRCEHPRDHQRTPTPAADGASATTLPRIPSVTSSPIAEQASTGAQPKSSKPSQSSRKQRVVHWQPLTLKEAELVLLKKSLGAGGQADKMTALLSKHVEAERGKLLSGTLSGDKGGRVKAIQTQRGEYTIYRTTVPADAQSAGGERIKVLFTPTICKVRCTQGHCTNFCERGNITTLYSTNHGRPEPGSGFRVFLCPLLCQNGGVCIQKDRCLCPPTFTGKFCHIPVRSSTNEIGKLPPAAALSSNQQRLTESEYTLPLQNHQSLQSGGSSLVKVRVQHPPEASVKIHQVLRVRGVQEEAGEQQADTDVGTGGLSGRRHSLLPGERAEAPPPRVQAQTVRGDPSYTESSGFKYCFGEVRNGQCSSPLPGLRSQETCCRGAGLAWGITECILCSTLSGSGGSGDRSCPQGFERRNGTQCVAQKVISEDKGQCYRLLTSGICSLPILRNITKQICCCSRVGKGWGRSCERCPPFGSADFKEICPAGPGYHYSASTVKLNPRLVNLQGGGASLDSQIIAELQFGGVPTAQPTRGPTPPVPPRTSPPRDDRRPLQPVRPLPAPVPTRPGLRVCEVSPLICGPGRCMDQLGGGYSCICNPGYQLNAQQTRCQDVDECRRSPPPCGGGRCENSEGGYRCTCPVGYRPGPQGRSCADVDECAQTPRLCSGGRCENTPGSYRCVCPPGYRLGAQGTHCLDVDECRQTPSPCANGRCDNTPGSYRCSCASGFKLHGNQCVDINECENPLVCPGQECVNSAGSFQCVSCRPGYRLQSGRCTDVDECRQTPSPCANGRCDNTPGSYRCSCASGFKLRGNQCVDVDECENPLVCPGQECVNSVGSYQCLPCRPGYTLQTGRCTDVDECRQTPSPCANGRCDNTPGSYRCSCASGFKLHGNECVDVNECENPLICPGQECVNSAGSFQCIPCRQGYRLQNGRCTDVDECASPVTCGPGSRCVNTEGSYRCDCRPGFRPDSSGRLCKDINECLEGEYCFPQGECLNTEGSYQCLCSEGYKTTAEGSSCVDVDECARPGLCQDGRCTNTEGSFECQCLTGFTTNPERTACLDVDECAESRGAVCRNQRCENTIGSFHCITICEPGYRVTASGDCVDINECANNTICGEHAFCQNLMGSYQCMCDPGYETAEDGRRCMDVNECESMPGVCGAARCENVEGTFLCNCRNEQDEYDPQTRQCVSRPAAEPRVIPINAGGASVPDSRPQRSDAQECYYNTGDTRMCSTLSRNTTHQECCCTIGEGWGLGCSFTPCPAPGTEEFRALCPRGQGYVTTGLGSFSYQDVDECKIFHPEICKNGVCSNNIPGFNCYCFSGYYYDSTLLECIDNNECDNEEACKDGQCINTEGSYYCTCQAPLVLDDTQMSCINTTSEDLDENLAYCWQELTLDLVCQRPLPERQVTFTECCCLYGEAWGLKCALCPGRDTEAYETMCNTLRPPAYGPSFGGRYRPMLGGDYGAPYGPNIFAEPPPRPGGPDFLIPGYEDYSPLADRGTSSRRRPPYGLREGPYGRRGPNPRYEIGEYEPQYVPPEPDPESRYGIPNPLSEPAYELLPRQGVGSLPAAPPFDQGEPGPPEPWLRYRPREGPPFPERGAAGGTRRELYDSRYEPHEGFQAEECGILHGCDNGRCIRVSEGYTCDCYDGYQLDMTNMACIDVNECEEEGDPGTLCVNGQCVNTDGSYECVCLRGFVVSRQPHYCVPAPPLQ